ncbi:MAG: ATP-binding cassette domain-containing protein, partial [Collinsella sp.]|nr:ATP-binding cassette domain-containing protein [Collinsella sp.]
YGLENFGIPHDQIEQRIVSALDEAGILDLRHRDIATLSGGQKQKVAIAAILALRPRALVLDEPTAALDPASAALVFETLREINASHGVTVIVIEQMVALLSRFCPRIVVMDRGRIAMDGSPREVFSHGPALREIGVDSPRVVRIFNRLVQEGICPPGLPCLDVEDARDLIAGICSRTSPAAAAPADPIRAGNEGGEVVLELAGACHSYPSGKAAVIDVDLRVHSGEIVAVVGRNGAGKTTITKLANGLLAPGRGRVVAAGLDTADTPVSTIARRVATLFQNPDRQICKETVLDEVAFGPCIHGAPEDQARARALSVIERFKLPAQAAPFTLSRGQRQMVALASVIVMEPRLVILDEPTSGLDYRECMTVMETVREMADRGCAVLMVCHDMEVVSDFADRIVAMADGRVLADGDRAGIFGDIALMERAGVAPPQVMALSHALARDVSPRFAGATEVDDIVRIVKELISHG